MAPEGDVTMSCIRTALSRRCPLTVLCIAAVLGLALFGFALAQPLGETAPTTELTCNFGMAKGQGSHSCVIAVPAGCVVANFPGSNKPWSNISKGGLTTCRFDEAATDWKTRVTGTCGRCKTVQCSARFSIMVQCGR
jgi:hypothetical protein